MTEQEQKEYELQMKTMNQLIPPSNLYYAWRGMLTGLAPYQERSIPHFDFVAFQKTFRATYDYFKDEKWDGITHSSNIMALPFIYNEPPAKRFDVVDMHLHSIILAYSYFVYPYIPQMEEEYLIEASVIAAQILAEVIIDGAFNSDEPRWTTYNEKEYTMKVQDFDFDDLVRQVKLRYRNKKNKGEPRHYQGQQKWRCNRNS